MQVGGVLISVRPSSKKGMRKLLSAIKDNSLSLALFALFVICIGGAIWTGWLQQNDTLAAHHRAGIGLPAYLGSGSFIEGLAVNWQAAVLQLASLIVFSSFLYQRGSPHSRKPHGRSRRPRFGIMSGWARRNSLFLAFLALFLVTFVAHVIAGLADDNSRRALSGTPPLSIGHYLVSSRFWWENFQTWEAEYLVIALYLVLSIFLRQEGSAESKPVDAADGETGEHNE